MEKRQADLPVVANWVSNYSFFSDSTIARPDTASFMASARLQLCQTGEVRVLGSVHALHLRFFAAPIRPHGPVWMAALPRAYLSRLERAAKGTRNSQANCADVQRLQRATEGSVR